MAELLQLLHRRPDGETDTYHLKPGRRFHIGRGSTSEIRILDMKMSRQHCAVEHRDGVWLLIDLGSTNGVYVNGYRVTGATPLTRGNNIVLGNTSLEVITIDTASHRRASEDPLSDPGTATQRQADLRPASDPHLPGSDPLTRTVAEAMARQGQLADAEDDGDATHDDDARRLSDQDLRFEPQEASPADTGPLEVPGEAGQPISIRAAKNDEATPTVNRPATSDQLLYINVHGQRVGPLTRAQARDLKGRELTGELTDADLGPFLDT